LDDKKYKNIYFKIMKIIDFLNHELNIVVKIVIDSIGSSNLIKR